MGEYLRIAQYISALTPVLDSRSTVFRPVRRHFSGEGRNLPIVPGTRRGTNKIAKHILKTEKFRAGGGGRADPCDPTLLRTSLNSNPRLFCTIVILVKKEVD